MDNYQKYIAKSRYARWVDEKGRREEWDETVGRYLDFFSDKLDTTSRELLRSHMTSLKSLPSMRAIMTAGEALSRDNVAGFNCSYLVVDHPRAFDELMYILMCGTGVGFSVERQYVQKLPELPEQFHTTDTVIDVADSKVGWAKAFRELLSLLWAGHIPSWDVSKVRPSGSRLKTFGGRASGPEPLDSLFRFTVNLFTHAAGRKLTDLECHDLCCKIADIVVVGGVRRSALISLSNLGSDRMRKAKMGQWWDEFPHRALANNSVVYTEKPDFQTFLAEWSALYESKCGERGIVSRPAMVRQAGKYGRRDSDWDFGLNPCAEIVLRPNQFCNLSEVVLRADDTKETIKEKVVVATILGTLQSTLTNFRYLRSVWKKNTEEERLLGVSLTGICDNAFMADYNNDELKIFLEELRVLAVETNKDWAARLGINPSTAITCVKPSGTVSQLVNSSSGIHGRFSPYYIRRVRADKKDPLAIAMKQQGVPCEDDRHNPSVYVFSFPQKSPEGSVIASAETAIEQLERWKVYAEHWCEHKPSVTIYYSDDEFLEVGQWVWDNFDILSGVSFLPRTDHVYEQAPYEAISKEKYDELVAAMPGMDWEALNQLELDDMTEGSQTLACTGGSCEL